MHQLSIIQICGNQLQIISENLTFHSPFFQIYDKNVLLNFILDTVSKTNMIDYTADIRERLELPEKVPEELDLKRATVLAKLKELQLEVAPLMKCMEDIKTRDSMKDSKTLINVLQTEYDVSFEFFVSFLNLTKFSF